MMTLTQLRKTRKQLMSEIRKIEKDISDAETSLYIPRAKKRFEGKFFKYSNSYGSTDSSGYPMKFPTYIYVKKVIGILRAKQVIVILMVSKFEIDCYGKIEFIDNHETFSSVLGKKISKEEFMKAYNAALVKAAALTG